MENNNIKNLAIGFELCLDFLKKGIEMHYNNWIKDIKNHVNTAPEINIQWQGYELQCKRYEIIIKILKCKKITENEYKYLILQDIINNFFEKNSISYDNFLTDKNIIEICKNINKSYFNYLYKKPRIKNFFGTYSIFYDKDLNPI